MLREERTAAVKGRTAAWLSGGELKRQRAMAHKALYFQAMDAFLSSLHSQKDA
jgi:hypothetical protein